MATHAHSTRTPGAGQVVGSDRIKQMAEPLPPVIELGRSLAAIDAEYDRLDEITARDHTIDASAALENLAGQKEALRRLIASLPAATMADAAVQLAVACDQSSRVHECDWSGSVNQRRLRELSGAVYRISLSVLPLVAKAAGLDMAAMGWANLVDLRSHALGLGDNT